MPAVWTEAHHITPWYAGGHSCTDNGCLLCSHHHDLIEAGNWTITVRHGIPWFIPRPASTPTKNPAATSTTTPHTPPARPCPLLPTESRNSPRP